MPIFKNIGFYGYADAKEADDPFVSAYQTAKLCAENGYTVVNGAGPGIMKAATFGAHEGNGRAIGITFYPKDLPLFEGRDETNNVDHLIVCENYLERTLKLLETSQIHVFFNGGTGTISEFAMAWGLARLYYGHHKPLILFGNFWQEIIHSFMKGMYIRPEEKHVFTIVNKPDEVISNIHEFEKNHDLYQHLHDNPVFSI